MERVNGMSLREIRTITKFQTSDGTEHSTREMAEHWLKLQMLSMALSEAVYLRADVDPQNIINWIGDHAKEVREYLDACDAMAKATLR